MKPHELLPDELDSLVMDGQTVRKGTVGAFIQNALALSDPQITAAARQTIEAELIDLIPSMKALRVFEVFELRDDNLRRLIVSNCPDLQI